MGEELKGLDLFVHWQVYMCVIDGDCNCAIVSKVELGLLEIHVQLIWVYISPLVLVTLR